VDGILDDFVEPNVDQDGTVTFEISVVGVFNEQYRVCCLYFLRHFTYKLIIAGIYIYMCVCVRVYVCMCVCVCVYVCMFVYQPH